MITENPTWISKKQAAEHIGRTVRTLETYVRNGQLPAYRIGGRKVVLNLKDVRRLADELDTPQLIRASA